MQVICENRHLYHVYTSISICYAANGVIRYIGHYIALVQSPYTGRACTMPQCTTYMINISNFSFMINMVTLDKMHIGHKVYIIAMSVTLLFTE